MQRRSMALRMSLFDLFQWGVGAKAGGPGLLPWEDTGTANYCNPLLFGAGGLRAQPITASGRYLEIRMVRRA